MEWNRLVLSSVIIAYFILVGTAIYRGVTTYRAGKLSIATAFFNNLYCGQDTCDTPIVDLPVPSQTGTTYDKTVARYCADLVVRVEAGNLATPPKGLTLLNTVDDKTESSSSKFGAIWTSPGVVWIAYRGTARTNMEEWFQDLNYAQQGLVQATIHPVQQAAMRVKRRPGVQADVGTAAPMVHTGFLDVYSQFQATIHEALEKVKPTTVIVTGHSLGAAVATVTGLDLSETGYTPIVYNFASPVVGGGDSCQVAKNMTLYRHVNTTDVVPGVPYSVCPNIKDPTNPYFYTHCGKALYFTINNKSLGNNHGMITYVQGFTENLYSDPVQ